MTSEELKAARERLNRIVGDWESDGSHPANYIRRTGLGREIARVDRWCGGYQSPSNPVVIGYRVEAGNRAEHDVVVVAGFPDVEAAIAEAKRLADLAIPKIASDAGHPVVEVVNSLAALPPPDAFTL
ncbi:MAG TPA: hypothetical protein VIY27_12505 [Myxococcota bacterium]